MAFWPSSVRWLRNRVFTSSTRFLGMLKILVRLLLRRDILMKSSCGRSGTGTYPVGTRSRCILTNPQRSERLSGTTISEPSLMLRIYSRIARLTLTCTVCVSSFLPMTAKIFRKSVFCETVCIVLSYWKSATYARFQFESKGNFPPPPPLLIRWSEKNSKNPDNLKKLPKLCTFSADGVKWLICSVLSCTTPLNWGVLD